MKTTNKGLKEFLLGLHVPVSKDYKVEWLLSGKKHSLLLSGAYIKNVSPLSENEVPDYNVQFNYSNCIDSEPPKFEED